MGKKGYNKNRKKKGGKAASVAATKSKTMTEKERRSKAMQELSNLPHFHDERSNSDATKPKLGTAAGGIYEIYKDATASFVRWMKETLPDSKMTSVNDLGRGADEILKRNVNAATIIDPSDDELSTLVVPPIAVLKDLSTSIHYRELLSKAVYREEGDNGHEHIIRMLKHCRVMIDFARDTAKVVCWKRKKSPVAPIDEGDGKNSDTVDAVGGRFNALLIDDDDYDEEQAQRLEKTIEDRSFPTFQPSESVEDLGIEESLIKGDDFFQATALLLTMDQLMGAVDRHFRLLKNVLRQQDSSASADDSIIKLLMECTVVANMATESVTVAEASLMVNQPHLSSFYHVLARVFLWEIIAEVKKEISPSKSEANPHLALNFVADIVESAFHNRGKDRVKGNVKTFCKKSGVSFTIAEKLSMRAFQVIYIEIMREVDWNRHPNRFGLEGAGIKPHQWLMSSPFIGGSRSILNTQHLVQSLMDIVRDETKLVSMPGFFGPTFDEKSRPARKIRGDLDEAFAASILPELVESCRIVPFYALPERKQLLTVLDLLNKHMKGNRTDPVPVALSFGLQTILTSIFVLQGDGDLAYLADCAKKSFNKLFDQLGELLAIAGEKKNNTPIFFKNLSQFINVVEFAKPLSVDLENLRSQGQISDPATAERLAFWNPVIGGEFLLYASYLCSIGLGSTTVDSLGQLRLTLHLYNALKQRKKDEFAIPFLETLDKAFSSTKAIWVGGRPERGSYCKSFWIAWGLSFEEASKLGSRPVGRDKVVASITKNSRKPMTRDLDEIRPEEYSVSYGRLVNQNFSDNQDTLDYTIINQEKNINKQDASLVDLLTRVNTTRDSMDDDGDFVLSTNFTAIGCILLDFINALSDHMGWAPLIDNLIKEFPGAKDMRTGFTMGGSRLKGFTASDLNFKHQALAHFWGDMMCCFDEKNNKTDILDLLCDSDEIEKFTFDFFQKISPDKYRFFVETKEEQRAANKRNPLKGSYPYGRTGQSPQDPLHAFFHLKYGKRGQNIARLIKPGRYTPYQPSPDVYAESPYEEPGSKLKRGPSGKFRHIASYSLDELIDLGWDGAMYVAKGRHAADGLYVPFIPGYDSDEDDQYENIDIEAGRRTGTIGILQDKNNCYMEVPDIQNPGRRILTKLNVK